MDSATRPVPSPEVGGWDQKFQHSDHRVDPTGNQPHSWGAFPRLPHWHNKTPLSLSTLRTFQGFGEQWGRDDGLRSNVKILQNIKHVLGLLGFSLCLTSFPCEVSGFPNSSFTLSPWACHPRICQSSVDIPSLAASMTHLLMEKWKPKKGKRLSQDHLVRRDDSAKSRRQGSGHRPCSHSNHQTSSASTVRAPQNQTWPDSHPTRTYEQTHQQCLSTWKAGKMIEPWKY